MHHCSGLPYSFHKPSVLHQSTSTVHLSSVTDAMAQELWPTPVGNVSNTVPFPETTATHSHRSVVGHSLWHQSSPEPDETRHHLLANQDLSLHLPKRFKAFQVLRRFLLLLEVTCVIFARATNTEVLQAIVARATKSRKNCRKPP